MGDIRRNEVFAEFLFRNFPRKKFESVLVAADGKGELALLLSRKYRVHVFEPQARQEHFRKGIKYDPVPLQEWYKMKEDFIVGMHPDEATSIIIRVANNSQKKWAVVPCCIRGPGSEQVHGFKHWVNYLERLSTKQVSRTQLEFSGKNIVLWTP